MGCLCWVHATSELGVSVSWLKTLLESSCFYRSIGISTYLHELKDLNQVAHKPVDTLSGCIIVDVYKLRPGSHVQYKICHMII